MASKKVCTIDGCGWRHKAFGLCRRHYIQYRSGTLEKPEQTEGPTGMRIKFPYAVRKIDGVWHRRPTDSKERWVRVVWEST